MHRVAIIFIVLTGLTLITIVSIHLSRRNGPAETTKVVREYVAKTKQWPTNHYQVKVLDERTDAGGWIVDVIHRDDGRRIGGGKSIRIYL